jgi:hypothetical protein
VRSPPAPTLRWRALVSRLFWCFASAAQRVLDSQRRESQPVAATGDVEMTSQSGIAIVRQHVERIDGVSRTWFEWTLREKALTKTLVVEVDFDTDPNGSGFRGTVMDAIHDTAVSVLTGETTMIVSDLKIVPKR